MGAGSSVQQSTRVLGLNMLLRGPTCLVHWDGVVLTNLVDRFLAYHHQTLSLLGVGGEPVRVPLLLKPVFHIHP